MDTITRIPVIYIPNSDADLNNMKFAFQPIFDVRTGDIYGHEALMRPEGCTPLELISAYEKAGRLDKIEETTIYYGTKAFMEAELDGFLFLNSIPETCMSEEMAIATSELGGSEMADRFYIEMLEYTKHSAKAWDLKKKAIIEAGAMPHLAIDDFGTGENIDLVCINTYNPDLIKIDRKYITNIDTDPINQMIFDDMIKNIHKRGIQVLAEGVETEEEYLYLMHTEVDYMQGYYLGKPRIYSK